MSNILIRPGTVSDYSSGQARNSSNCSSGSDNKNISVQNPSVNLVIDGANQRDAVSVNEEVKEEKKVSAIR